MLAASPLQKVIRARSGLGVNHINSRGSLPCICQRERRLLKGTTYAVHLQQQGQLPTILIECSHACMFKCVHQIPLSASPGITGSLGAWTPSQRYWIAAPGRVNQEHSPTRFTEPSNSNRPSPKPTGQRLSNDHAQRHTSCKREYGNVNQRQKMPQRRTRSYVVRGGVLTAEEGQLWAGMHLEQANRKEDRPSMEPKQRAPRLCSVCGSPKHIARTCLQGQGFGFM